MESKAHVHLLLLLLLNPFAGGPKPQVNPEGVAYYNNIINGLLKKGLFK